MVPDSKFMSLLGMCRRAGKLSCGHDAAVDSIRSKTAKLCILTGDSSERLKKEMQFKVEHFCNDIPIVEIEKTMDETGHAVGLKSAVLTVNDAGFAKSLTMLLANEQEG